MISQKDTRWAALAVLLAGQMMIAVDVSVVNIALPTIQAQLHFSQAALAWVVNAYLISFGGFMLLAGRLGDIIGRTRIFLWGLLFFTFASALCGLAPTATLLVAARFLQGIGGALVGAVLLGILFTLFREPLEQSKALGYYSFIISGGAALGLVIGGSLTQYVSWHWIFFINVPVGLAAYHWGRRLIPPHQGLGWGAGIDWPGVVLMVAAPLIFVYGVIRAGEVGWGSGSALGWMGLGLLLGGLFILVERARANPLLPFAIFKTPNLVAANIAMTALIIAFFSSYFILALYFQIVRGFSPLLTGAAFLPMTLTFGALGSTIVPRAMNRFGLRRTILTGVPLFVLGFVLLTLMPYDASYFLYILPTMVVFALGGSLSMLPLNSLAMAGVAHEDAGLASGILNTNRQVGGAIGLAAISSIAALWATEQVARGVTRPEALTAGYHVAFAICVALGLVVGLIALFIRPRAAYAPSAQVGFMEREEVAELL